MGLACPFTVLPISEPDPNHVRPGKEERSTMLAEDVDVVIGVDTHKHTHTAAAVAATTGAVVDHRTEPTDRDGYAALVAWADRQATLRVWAVEGSGGYGAGLVRFLARRGEVVVELDRPNRPARRNGAKSDPLDAVRAAREALSRDHLAQPRAAGERAALAALLAARRSAVDAAVVAQQQLHALVTTAPDGLRSRFRGRSTRQMLAKAARMRVDGRWDVETRTAALVLRTVARRCAALQAEAEMLEQAILTVVRSWRPDLLEQPGVGPIVAAVVLCAWSHSGRCRSEAAFANLAGVAPIPASSGMTIRHRLNRCGDRQLNRALHVTVLSRLRYDSATRAYANRRRAEGKTEREIKRCLKRLPRSAALPAAGSGPGIA
jgi:transposase